LPTHVEHDALGDHLLRQKNHGAEDEYDTETESVGPIARFLFEPNPDACGKAKCKPHGSQQEQMVAKQMVAAARESPDLIRIGG